MNSLQPGVTIGFPIPAGGRDETLLRGLRHHDKSFIARDTPRRRARRRELSQAELYKEAERLGLRGRSKMDTAELADAIRAKRESRSRGFVGGLLSPFTGRFRHLGAVGGEGLALAFMRRPRPVRIAVLTVATLAAGGLGLMAAYAVSPEEESAAQVLVTNGSTLRIATITGPGGTTTVAITKTKEGKTKVVPVRILKTVTGPGGTETVSVAVLGPAITVTDQQILTQIQTQIQTNTQFLTETQVINQTETQVITQPVTVVVTDVVTVNQVDTQFVTVTDTVVNTVTVEVTVTVPPPP